LKRGAKGAKVKVTKRQLRKIIKEEVEATDESRWKDFRKGVPIEAGSDDYRRPLLYVGQLRKAILMLDKFADARNPGAADTTIWIAQGSEFRPIRTGDVRVSSPDETIQDADDGKEYKPGIHVIIGKQG
jgi:soluble cytochrome b562